MKAPLYDDLHIEAYPAQSIIDMIMIGLHGVADKNDSCDPINSVKDTPQISPIENKSQKLKEELKKGIIKRSNTTCIGSRPSRYRDPLRSNKPSALLIPNPAPEESIYEQPFPAYYPDRPFSMYNPGVSLQLFDDIHFSEGSLSAISATSEHQSRKAQDLPATKENLLAFRQEATQSDEPSLQLDFAKFLLKASNQLNDGDPERDKIAREVLVMEAQKVVKKLASYSGRTKQSYPEAQFFLANCYGQGDMGLAVDIEKAFELYVQGSKQGHPQCTFRAAVCYEVGVGTKRDKNHAMQFYRKAANLGDPMAMYKLGVILLKGFLNQPINHREGISWLKRAAEQADEIYPHALHELGLAYEKDGIPCIIPDANYARELFTQAAEYGYAASQFKLGQAYENGFLNCPVDPRRSIAWYSKAAEQGEVEAEFALSGWYLTGADGILSQNDREAYLWARKAADKGHAKAEYAIGYYTETGTGTEKNLEEAKIWYRRAAANNYTRATKRLNELKNEDIDLQQQNSEHTFKLFKREGAFLCRIM
ncbi:hypothetical protein G6F46_002858 [Rhizopus delemar]|nr:hypothetical protein G6F55_001244 [Rhizopus delemar]KAG1549768.1 hypothetical protein G6F51_002858 [Rhizopus arrhizus]KAG1503363.1 hypothetical protein G6F54_001729 [Rhizopus delemar]KAG1517952.1 hypothetical protein G6F53_000969 [Rhizopus delemar]KAG1528149.1 hypothetical protein G6F52_000902 [Rhizopus delemar]